MSAICVITARGGSKRIPKKNIKEFCGKPIIAYSIEAALESEMFDEVMVSTDDSEIAKVAEEYGATVPFMRSKRMSDDYATTAGVLLEVLEKYAKLGKTFDYMCCLYPTAPFVRVERIVAAVEAIKKHDVIEIVPVVEFSFPPQRCFELDDKKLLQYKYPEYRNSRSQDLPKLYHDAGQFYVYDVGKFLECNGQVSDNMMPVIIDEIEAQDIDNETDWRIAELKYEILRRNTNE